MGLRLTKFQEGAVWRNRLAGGSEVLAKFAKGGVECETLSEPRP